MSVHPRIAAARERSRMRLAPTKPGERGMGGSGGRWLETLALLFCSFVVAVGLFLTYQAKSQGRGTPDSPSFVEVEDRLAENRIVNLNAGVKTENIAPLLETFTNEDERQFAAQKIEERLKTRGPMPNVGALSSVAVEEKEVDESRLDLDSYRNRLEKRRKEREERRVRAEAEGRQAQQEGPIRLSVLPTLKPLKHSFIVRTPEQFRNRLFVYFALYLIAFYAFHVVWSVRRFKGDTVILPALHLLSGMGLIMTVSLFDPLRDLLYFPVFAQGIALGCAAILVLSFVDFQNTSFRRLSLIPLAASFLLSVVLILWGTGPAGSNAKVNLSVAGIKFQPVEAITRLLVLFLAAYFAQNWEFLRELKEERPRISSLIGKLNLPRLGYLAPVLIGMVLALLFFLLQQDLGPALVMFCTFLALYGVARRRAGLVTLGLAALILSFAVSYRFEKPATIRPRIDMWLSPWKNDSEGGDQLVKSLWAFSAGSVTGTGLGLGDADEPGVLPAAHTDMVLAAVGEELGFGGVLAVFVLFAILVYRGFLIALRAPGHYTFFLALGLTVNSALQFLLITGGALGLIPLSGVVLPFLSFGRTALIANLAAFGVLLAISGRAKVREEEAKAFRVPVKVLGVVLGALALPIIAKAAYVQVYKADEMLVAKPNVVIARRGGKPVIGELTNPRIEAVARNIKRGSVYDRNGIPIATSNRAEIEQFRNDFREMGINVDELRPSRDGRYRPFGGITFHLLGGLGTEHDKTLRGYTDDHELLPLVRYRYNPDHPAFQEFMSRVRDLRLSIDAPLQVKVAKILEAKLAPVRRAGAAVVTDSQTGELLASVSYPWPGAGAADRDDPSRQAFNDDDEDAPEFDKARMGHYPPGSTFKLVTAIAALRKDPALDEKTYKCEPLADGENGVQFGRFVVHDSANSHGDIRMRRAVVVSCNAFFAQLGHHDIGPKDMLETANLLRIESLADPNTPAGLKDFLPHASYGQGEVLTSPLSMARVVSTIANGGTVTPDVLVIGEQRARGQEPRSVIERSLAEKLALYMHEVVTGQEGTARRLSDKSIAGKTGTAEFGVGRKKEKHAWFVGFAPFDSQGGRRVAFSVLLVRGGTGGTEAAPVAQEIVAAARARKLIR